MNRYLDMTFFQCLNFGKLFSVVFIYVKPTRIYQKTLCCNLFQLGYLYMLVSLYYYGFSFSAGDYELVLTGGY